MGLGKDITELLLTQEVADPPVGGAMANGDGPLRRGFNLQLTLTEVGVISSILSSLLLAAFTVGIVYAQVKNNQHDIGEMKPQLSAMAVKVERIDANVEFMRELAEEQRTGRPAHILHDHDQD